MKDKKQEKNFRDAGEVDHNKVKEFFENKGYEVLEIHQIWRHIHGRLKKDNQIFFFKLSSTKDIGERTANEVAWNNQMQKILVENRIDYFSVPKVFETGNMDDNFYYIGEYFGGKLLGTKEPRNLTGLDNWLEKIAKANIFLSGIKEMNLPRDKGKIPAIEQWDDYFKKIKEWYDIADNPTLEPLLNKVEELKTTYHRGLSHADFAPWHMIANGDSFVLIDAEHATTLWPRYYDVAHFYHRTYTSADSPEMAKKYLNVVKELLPEERRKTFDEEFLPILATRIVGGFFELKISKKKFDDKYHQMLKEDFLNDNLY
ncbi:MAG TPA: phosphotransferase [Patescibacteria group bacterium]|nr:phosphotransferase [Patescibacteria group bacterium]